MGMGLFKQEVRLPEKALINGLKGQKIKALASMTDILSDSKPYYQEESSTGSRTSVIILYNGHFYFRFGQLLMYPSGLVVSDFHI
jgi:hypothetical protein